MEDVGLIGFLLFFSVQVVGKDVPHPGAGVERQGDERKYHKYYQWVCFVLFFQVRYGPRGYCRYRPLNKLWILVRRRSCSTSRATCGRRGRPAR